MYIYILDMYIYMYMYMIVFPAFRAPKSAQNLHGSAHKGLMEALYRWS